MPILRYFVYVGGALLALLFICDAVFPQVALPTVMSAVSDRPAVRIRSERKWPERIVLDTSIPMTAPITVANADTVTPVAAAVDAKARVRDAFAQAGSSEVKQQPAAQITGSTPAKMADATVPKPAELKGKAKHKTARAQAPRPLMLVAQQPQPHFGWIGSTW